MSEYALIAGRYQIDTLIGRGGMGDVYRGTDTQTGQVIAIKLLHQNIVESNPDLVDRFQREGEALRQLNHPNIVKLLGAFEENNRQYLIIEYVSGGSLRELLDEQGRLPLEAVLNLSLDLADALTRAHRLSIVHRDIKPDNVLLAEDGTPRLTDFGVAHLGDRTRLTQTGSVIGTYSYLSPEACNGLELDERADIWSFGVMLYEMLTGRVPFQETSTAAVITAILTKPAPDVMRLRPNTPEKLANLIYKMLEKDRARRISSVRLIGAELETIIHELDTPLRQLVLAQSQTHEESRFSTPPDQSLDVPAMVRSTPDQTHGFSLYPAPGGPSAASVPGVSPTPGGMMYTPGGTPYATGTMVPVSTSKWPWIALTIIVTVLACSLVAVLAIFFGPDSRKNRETQPPPPGSSATPVNTPAGNEQGTPVEPTESGASQNQALPAIEPVGPGEYMVLVANLENLMGVVQPSGGSEASRFILNDLKETLERTVAFSNLRVRSYPRAITSEEEAVKIAEQTGATVVVWGSYTPDLIEVTVQIGSLASFPYNKFDRDVLDRTANVRLHLTDPRTESVAPQVLGVMSLLQNADGNGFESLRNGAIQGALKVTSAQIVGNSVAAYVHRYLLDSDPAQAMQDLNTALGLDPGNPLLYTCSSILKQRQGLLDSAREDAQTALRIGPPNWSMPVLLLANLQQDQSVIELFSQVVVQRPDDWFPLFFRGIIYYQLVDVLPNAYDLARADLEGAIALKPQANFPYVYAALLALRQGRLQDAQQAIGVIVTDFPDPSYLTRLMQATFQGMTPDSYEVILSAFTNQTLGRYDTVLQDASRGLEAYPNMQDIHFLEGMSHCALGNYEAAEKSFSAEEAVSPSFDFNILMRASARLHLEDTKGAEADFKMISGRPLAKTFAPYIESVRTGDLDCARFFNSTNFLPLPTERASASETATPVPGVTPTVEPVKPGEYRVLVAQMEPLKNVAQRDVARFVAENLTRTFEEDIPNTGVQVRRYPAIISSDDEARAVAEANGATVIVWGDYTPSMVELEVQVGVTTAFPHIPFTREMVDRSANVRVSLADETRQSVAMQVLGVLNVLANADGDEFGMIATLMYAAAVNMPSGVVEGSSVAAHIHRALLSYQTDSEKTVQELTAALQVDSSNTLIYIYRSLANLRAGAMSEAASDLESARRLGPPNWTLPMYMLVEGSGNVDHAQAMSLDGYNAIVALRPDDWFIYFLRGIATYYGVGDFESAKADLQKAIALGPRSNLPYIPLLMIALREGRMADAQAIMRTMLTEYPDPQLTNRAMQALYGSAAVHDYTGTLFSAATNLVLGQYDNVVNEVQVMADFLASHPGQVDISQEARNITDLLMLQGLAYCNLQNYSAAQKDFDQAIQVDSSFELLYLLRGQMSQLLDESSRAQQDFAHARVNKLGPEFAKWVEAAVAGQWTCQNMLEYKMPE